MNLEMAFAFLAATSSWMACVEFDKNLHIFTCAKSAVFQS